MTTSHKTLDGVTFTIKQRTMLTRAQKAQYDAAMADFVKANPAIADELRSLAWVVAHTAGVEVGAEYSDLLPLQKFWAMVEDGESPAKWVAFYAENVWEGVLDKWIEAYNAADRSVPLSKAEKAKRLLTDEERADPKS